MKNLDKIGTQIEKKTNDFSEIVKSTFPANSTKIITEKEREVALELRRLGDDILKEIDETFDPIIKLNYQAHKLSVKTKKDKQDSLLKAKSYLNMLLLAYENNKKELERREQQRLEAAAKREQEERRMLEAAELIDEGREAEAEELLEEKLPEPIVARLEPVKSNDGVYTRDYYSCEVTDAYELYRAVVEGFVPWQALQPNQDWLDAMARLGKEQFDFPGCKLVKKSSVTVKR